MAHVQRAHVSEDDRAVQLLFSEVLLAREGEIHMLDPRDYVASEHDIPPLPDLMAHLAIAGATLAIFEKRTCLLDFGTTRSLEELRGFSAEILRLFGAIPPSNPAQSETGQ